MTITDEPTRQNFIARLENERLLIAEKAQSHDQNYHHFLMKNLNSLVGLIHDHRDQAQFLHQREGFRSGADAWAFAAREIEWALNELKRQSAEYQSELNQLEAA